MEKSPIHSVSAVDRAPAPAVTAVHRPLYLIEPIRTLLLDRFVPAAVFVNRQGQVVYIHGRTGAYLEPAPGLAPQQLIDMAREGLRRELIAALHLAEKQKGPVVRKGIRLSVHGTALRVTVSVTPIAEPEALEGLLLVTFETESVAAAGPSDVHVQEPQSAEVGLVLDLQYTQQRLQRTIEELQLSNEEFRSAYEEMQSTNEELQSTNEELETAKEELQSLNEELVTVNAELQDKLDELEAANDDLQNLLNSTEVATVFLDKELRIRRFTPEDARAVFQTLIYREREVVSLDGRWYLLRISCSRTSTSRCPNRRRKPSARPACMWRASWIRSANPCWSWTRISVWSPPTGPSTARSSWIGTTWSGSRLTGSRPAGGTSRRSERCWRHCSRTTPKWRTLRSRRASR